jgi:DNA-binding GntR family transcriptional regulator
MLQKIDRKRAADEVTTTVRAMVLDGSLADGARINEVRLADALGVSRTPLREGLSRLVSEGALSSCPGRGFSVRPLTLEEFNQLYDIRPLLDPEALRLAGLPSRACMERLDKINQKLLASRSPETAIDIDDAWHRELIANCPNKVLLELIDDITLRTRRYELALMRTGQRLVMAGEEHAEILAAARSGDLKAACAALRSNLETGKASIAAWLKTRQTTQRKVGS